MHPACAYTLASGSSCRVNETRPRTVVRMQAHVACAGCGGRVAGLSSLYFLQHKVCALTSLPSVLIEQPLTGAATARRRILALRWWPTRPISARACARTIRRRISPSNGASSTVHNVAAIWAMSRTTVRCRQHSEDAAPPSSSSKTRASCWRRGSSLFSSPPRCFVQPSEPETAVHSRLRLWRRPQRLLHLSSGPCAADTLGQQADAEPGPHAHSSTLSLWLAQVALRSNRNGHKLSSCRRRGHNRNRSSSSRRSGRSRRCGRSRSSSSRRSDRHRCSSSHHRRGRNRSSSLPSRPHCGRHRCRSCLLQGRHPKPARRSQSSPLLELRALPRWSLSRMAEAEESRSASFSSFRSACVSQSAHSALTSIRTSSSCRSGSR